MDNTADKDKTVYKLSTPYSFWYGSPHYDTITFSRHTTMYQTPGEVYLTMEYKYYDEINKKYKIHKENFNTSSSDTNA